MKEQTETKYFPASLTKPHVQRFLLKTQPKKEGQLAPRCSANSTESGIKIAFVGDNFLPWIRMNLCYTIQEFTAAEQWICNKGGYSKYIFSSQLELQ